MVGYRETSSLPVDIDLYSRFCGLRCTDGYGKRNIVVRRNIQ